MALKMHFLQTLASQIYTLACTATSAHGLRYFCLVATAKRTSLSLWKPISTLLLPSGLTAHWRQEARLLTRAGMPPGPLTMDLASATTADARSPATQFLGAHAVMQTC